MWNAILQRRIDSATHERRPNLEIWCRLAAEYSRALGVSFSDWCAYPPIRVHKTGHLICRLCSRQTYARTNHQTWNVSQAYSPLHSGNRPLRLALQTPTSFRSLLLNCACQCRLGGCTESRHSTTGFLISVNGGPVTCNSQKQTVIALSSAESEYFAMSSCAQQITWLRRILWEI